MSSRLRNAAGGLGNTVPMYGSVARKAFLANCSIGFNETAAHGKVQRLFQFAEYFAPPESLPAHAWSNNLLCAVKAVTSTPTPTIAARARAVHDQLQTRWPPNAMQDADGARAHCCPATNAARRYLVGLHLRTGWADVRLNAERAGVMALECPATERAQVSPADEVVSAPRQHQQRTEHTTLGAN